MNTAHQSAWDGYRRWRKRFWIAVASIPVIFAVFGGSTAVATMVFLPLIIAITLFQGFKCPRCGEPFFYDRTWNPWRENCVHCSLPKWKEATFKDLIATVSVTPGNVESEGDLKTAEHQHISNFLTLVLRDDPGAIHLPLDPNSWADVQNLLTRATRYGFKLTREKLVELLTASEEHRFEWDKEGDRIRVVPN